ncbi:MAG: ABC transporter substrate-binding protein [Lyngbya sp. HA4199-MV5]|jgi:NitT/TauT family transport system substrate-binding protein|nr:ABC transporter substrate-binding protein [Lyngbya sp. HA4199-MV5]
MRRYDDLFHPIGSLNRRGFLRGCCIASLAFIASTSCSRKDEPTTGTSQPSTSASPGGKTTLRVGHLPAGCVSHLLLANKRGLFKEAGLNVELTQFNGPGENLQALVGGARDVIHNPWTNTVAAFAKGTDKLRIISGSGKGGIELVSRKGSVKTLDELAKAANKGLKIGTLQLDTLELVVFGHLKKLGVDYSGYKMTFFPSMVGMGEALIQNAVDVCSLAQPYAQSVVAKSGGTYLGDSNGAWGPEASDCVISSTSDFIKKEPNLVADYLAVLRKSAALLNSDYKSAIADLVPVYGSTEDVLSVALKRQVPQPVLDKAGLQSLKNGVGYLADLGYLKKDQTNLLDAVFDGSAQEKALQAA